MPHAPSSGIFTYKSYSLRFIGHVYYCREDYDRAIESLGKAIELSQGYTKAHYDLAQYYAVTGDARKAIPFLQKAIEKDSLYFNLAEREQNFNPIRDAVLQLLGDIKRDAYEKAQKRITNVEDALTDAEDSQAKVYALQEYGAAKAKLVLAMDKFDSGVYNAILEAKPIATEAYELATRAKDVALDVREKLKGIEEEKKGEKLKIDDTRRRNIQNDNIIDIFCLSSLIFIIMGFIKGDVGLYLGGAFVAGCTGGIVASFEDDSNNINIIIGFILAFIFAPLVAPLGLFSSVFIERPDIEKEHTKQLKELNEKYRQKLDILCDLGEGLKRGETLSVADWLNKGRSYAEAKSFDAAISCFDSALVLDPENEDVWISKGNSLEKLGRNNEAISCCDRALKINSENFKALHNMGLCLSNLNRIEEAVRYYDNALNINPNSEPSWFNKGLCMMKLNRIDEALTSFNKAIEMNPGDIDACIYKGRSLEELGEFEEAINCYGRALKINPEHKMAREYKEACLQKL